MLQCAMCSMLILSYIQLYCLKRWPCDWREKQEKILIHLICMHRSNILHHFMARFAKKKLYTNTHTHTQESCFASIPNINIFYISAVCSARCRYILCIITKWFGILMACYYSIHHILPCNTHTHHTVILNVSWNRKSLFLNFMISAWINVFVKLGPCFLYLALLLFFLSPFFA